MQGTWPARSARSVLLQLEAALLTLLLLSPVARAEGVETNAFPSTPGAIAFTSDRDGINNLQIYRMNGDGFGQARLTETLGMNQDPTWSADGKKIARGSGRFGPAVLDGGPA